MKKNINLFIYYVFITLLLIPMFVYAKEEKKVQILSGDGTKVGDKIAIGDQNFYVVEIDENYIQALAEYNLYVGKIFTLDGIELKTLSSSDDGYNLQSKNAKGVDVKGDRVGTLAFSNNNYWTKYTKEDSQKFVYAYDNNSILYQYVDNYIKYLNDKYQVNAQGNLLSYDQAIDLGCNASSGRCSLSWVYNTTYWLGSISEESDNLWHIETDNEFLMIYEYDINNICGVRPVIKISKNTLNEYINIEEQTEKDKETDDENKKENPNTGSFIEIGLITSGLIIAGVSIYISRKKHFIKL